MPFLKPRAADPTPLLGAFPNLERDRNDVGLPPNLTVRPQYVPDKQKLGLCVGK